MKKLYLIVFQQFMLISFALAQYGFQLNIPAQFDREIIVATHGNDDTGEGTESKPYSSLQKAVSDAKQHLSANKSVIIKILPGTFLESVNESDWTNAIGEEALLVIEGQISGSDSVIVKPALNLSNAPIYIRNKSSVVIKNLIFENLTEWGGIRTEEKGNTTPSVRRKNWLVENCIFRNSTSEGGNLIHLDYATFKKCRIYNTDAVGFVYHGRHGLIEEIEIYNTNREGISRFNNGGFSFQGIHNYVNKMHIHDVVSGAGFRMDHSCEDLIVENSTFERCHSWGMEFETCKGPVSVINCVINNNNKGGIKLSTVHDFTLSHSLLKDNKVAGIIFRASERSSPCSCVPPGWGCTGGNYDIEGSYYRNVMPLDGLRDISVLNTTIIASGANNLIYDREEGIDALWTTFAKEFTGINNVYWHTDNTSPFEITENIEQPEKFGTLQSWQALTGSEKNSYFGNPAQAPSLLGDNETAQDFFVNNRKQVDHQAVTFTIPVVNISGSWEVEVNEPWINASPTSGAGSGSIQVTVQSNDLALRRSALVAIRVNNSSDAIMVVQSSGNNTSTCVSATGLFQNNISENSATLNWQHDATDNFVKYCVNYREQNGDWIKGGVITETNLTLSFLEPGTKYQWKVQSICEDGFSTESNINSFTTTGESDLCELLNNTSFSQSIASWENKGNVEATHQTSQYRTPPGAMLIDISDKWQGMRQDIRKDIQNTGPGKYELSAWIKTTTGTGLYSLYISTKPPDGSNNLQLVTESSANSQQWVQLKGTVDVSWSSTHLQTAYVWVQAQNASSPDFYVDDFSLHLIECQPASIPTGLFENDENRPLLYPNPARGFINLRSQFPQVNSIYLVNAAGIKYFPEYNLQSESIQINIENMSSGIYTLVVERQQDCIKELFLIK